MTNSKIKTEEELKTALNSELKHMGHEWSISPCGPKFYTVRIYASLQTDGEQMLGSHQLEVMPRLGGQNNSVSTDKGRLYLLGIITLKDYRFVQTKERRKSIK